MMPEIACDRDADRAYITWRIIDCCLREDVRDSIGRGTVASPPPAVLQAWNRDATCVWWRIAHWPDGPVWLPVRRSDYMQVISALSDGWVREGDDGIWVEHGAERWLELIGAGLDEDARALHCSYADEAACAVAHRKLARDGYAGAAPALAQLFDVSDWAERALRAEQVASYRDHPYYPTARAKPGLDEAALRAHAPEFDPEFELHWLAVPKDELTRTTPAPACWPRMREIGLPIALESTHVVLPVHPLTWAQLDRFPMPGRALRAPRRYLRVRPTLSVRTVAAVDHPVHHIKLPLLMRTLGALNLRLIKPSTLYDGHWFQRVLEAIAAVDPALSGRYLHVDEAHGGHVADATHLTYLVRDYPPSLQDATLVPVAALCGEMPDGRPLALHLADRFHHGDLLAWWRAYAKLLCEVHLRLWLVHGIALEANQQNAVLIYREGRAPQLLMKDNDSARVLLPRLQSRLPDLAAYGPLRDERIAVDGDPALARMFCTITLQLCLLAVLEGLVEHDRAPCEAMYRLLREMLTSTLQDLGAEGIDTAPAWMLLHAPKLPVKYLLSAGSLLSKRASGAADINKFYGDSGPNFMLAPDEASATTQAGSTTRANVAEAV